MRLHPRKVEDVADEAREPVRLRADHPERRLLRLLVLRDPLAQRLDVPPDRGERRSQLVGDDHEEVALAPLRLGELVGHLGESLCEVADLVLRACLRKVPVVAACGDLVSRA